MCSYRNDFWPLKRTNLDVGAYENRLGYTYYPKLACFQGSSTFSEQQPRKTKAKLRKSCRAALETFEAFDWAASMGFYGLGRTSVQLSHGSSWLIDSSNCLRESDAVVVVVACWRIHFNHSQRIDPLDATRLLVDSLDTRRMFGCDFVLLSLSKPQSRYRSGLEASSDR